jgi:EmrB/QacA subfamily drug resistance transporter
MRKWWPLVAACLGVFILLVDTTIVNVALPAMASDLKASFASLQWVVDAYALALAALLLGAGSLADLIGRRAVYVAGLALFVVASLACGVAPSAGVLVAARGVQGAGAAAMLATSMALLNVTYQGRDRATAFAVWGSVSGAAAATGPILGGLLTQYLDWRAIFFVNLPVGAVAIALTLRAFAESRNPAARGIDLPGAATFTVAAGAVTYALIKGGEVGWASGETLGFFATAAVAVAAFIVVELRAPHAMLDLGLFRRPAFVGIMLVAMAFPAAAFGNSVYVSLWLQSPLRLGAVDAGLVLLPMSGAAFVVAAVAGRALNGVSPRLTLGVGMLLIGAGALLQTLVSAASTEIVLLPGLAVAGLGVGVASPALASAAMAAVPRERGGMASGAVNTFRQLGMAMGVAMLGAVFRARVEDALRGHVTDPGAATAALTDGQAGAGGHAARAAFASGLDAAYLVAGVLSLVTALAVFVLVRTSPAASGASWEPERVATVGPRGE